MTKKYQKPISRNLGDLATAEGACTSGFTVRNPCAVGSNFNICTVGSDNSQIPTCTAVGTSANANCNPFGVTAQI